MIAAASTMRGNRRLASRSMEKPIRRAIKKPSRPALAQPDNEMASAMPTWPSTGKSARLPAMAMTKPNNAAYIGVAVSSRAKNIGENVLTST